MVNCRKEQFLLAPFIVYLIAQQLIRSHMSDKENGGVVGVQIRKNGEIKRDKLM